MKIESKYRIIKYDVVNDIWLLQERHFFIFWYCVGAGSKEKLEKMIVDLENIDSIL
jgi:hypothetical protein